MRSDRRLIILFSIFVATFSCLSFLYASTSLSVTSFEGSGSTLNFGNIGLDSIVSREMRIRVDSDSTSEYQVRQVIIQPLTSREGETLKEEVLSFYTVVGSNAAGSLYKTIREPLVFKDDLLYISNSQGISDSFKLVYVIDGKKLKSPGEFFGKIGYVLETKGGASQTQIFNIEFNVKLDFRVSLTMPKSRLELSTRSDSDSLGYLIFNIEGLSAGQKLDIYQRLVTLPSNSKGINLPEDCLRFYTSEVFRGSGQYPSPTLVETRDILIYNSTVGADSFRVNFAIDKNKIKDYEADTYRGRLIYTIRQDDIEKIETQDIEIVIEKMFDMKISGDRLNFNVKPGIPGQEKKVVIEVNSNLQVPYQISQRMERLLSDGKGNTINAEFFTMRSEIVKGEGRLELEAQKPVEPKEMVLFTSDNNGGDAAINVIYNLAPSYDIVAGNYSAAFTYSLSEK